ncbi:MAG: hypothetical protein M1401_01665 [Chloroflexi bacterium]|nr:hypothetical protein [Chloroflexota bacterium]
MNQLVALPLLSTLVSLVFAATVFVQYRHRRKPYQLVWTIGLLWYAISAGTEFLGNGFGWNLTLYRWWYIIGAFYVAAYLGMGTVYLIVRRRYAHAIMALLVLGSLYAAYRVLAAPVDPALLPKAGEIVTGQALPSNVRILTPFFNVFGAGALVAGAVYSAWVFWRKGIMGHRVVSNILIALGAFIPSLTGGLSRFGFSGLFFLGELLGVVIIFLGFLVSVEVFERRRASAPRRAAS